MSQANDHHEEGLRLASTGKLHEAIPHFQRAAELEPANPVRHFNLGFTWQQLNRLPEAAIAYGRAVELAPDFFDAWNNLAAALRAANEIDAAVLAGQTAAALRPKSAAAHLNLGNALKAKGNWDEAESAYQRAIELEPSNPRHYLNLANSFRERGRVIEAIPVIRQAIAMSSNFAEAHRDLAFALLLCGGLEAGWPENEWRWETAEMSRLRRKFDQPAWRGEDLRGKRLLIYTEQGFGDAIQFSRYLPLAAELGAHIILECQPGLARLFRTLQGLSELIVRGSALPPFDYHVPLLSLPRLFRTSLANIPAKTPYLTAPAELPPSALSSVASRRESELKVGLVWAGNPGHLNDRNRSVPAEFLKPLFELPRMQFYSLQVGDRAADWAALHGHSAPATDLARYVTEYADTAALICHLDLVITVDTSVAHLAGALAKPVWLLLPFAPDWRWLLEREDSPWYPNMWLIRQNQPGDWNGVINRVVDRLKRPQIELGLESSSIEQKSAPE